jgi:4-hydroxy-4-methyl-2-oxoglutarate aldolase
MSLVLEKAEPDRQRKGHPPQRPDAFQEGLTDPEQCEWIGQTLYVAAVCDVLDGLGYTHQAMHQRLRPLDPATCTFVGRARTIQWMEANYVAEEDPYGLEIEAVDSLQRGQVVVHSTDYSWTNALWGELMSTVAQRNGVTGCICDGAIRDCRRIQHLKFPVFHVGVRPVDSKGRGRVMACDVPVRCGEVMVNPGELVFADPDGVVVIPLEMEDKVKYLAIEKVRKENTSRKELLAGLTLREVFDKYGVL